MNNEISLVQAEISHNWVADSLDATRLFHGRGHCFPGWEWLCIDWYPPFVLISLFDEAGAAQLPAIQALIKERLGESLEGIVVQKRYLRGTPFEVVDGEVPDKHQIQQSGLTYQLEFGQAQNVGFFLDMQPGREWLAQRCQGKNVLNLFAYTCAFSVVAMAHGAQQVVNIDLSRRSLQRGVDSHRLNGLPTDRVRFFDHNIFKSWKKLHKFGRYDIIIIDPPTFQKGSFDVQKDYRKILNHLHRLLKPEAEILACLNSPRLDEDFLQQQFEQSLPEAAKVARLPSLASFKDVDPQAALKAVHYHYQLPAQEGCT